MDYLKNEKHNPYAARNVFNDCNDSKKKLSYLADSLPVPDDPELKKRGLKRMNFMKHDYFMLFAIDGDTVVITNIFHAGEDYENKL